MPLTRQSPETSDATRNRSQHRPKKRSFGDAADDVGRDSKKLKKGERAPNWYGVKDWKWKRNLLKRKKVSIATRCHLQDDPDNRSNTRSVTEGEGRSNRRKSYTNKFRTVKSTVSGKGKRNPSKTPAHAPEASIDNAPSSSKDPGSSSTILLKAEVARLNRQLETKTQLINDHERLLSQFQQSLTCQVCLDLMYKPYALTPCGHLVCYACLVQWFTTLSGDAPPQPVHLRKKTCPHCRAVVREPPVQVWGVKGLVTVLAKSGMIPNASVNRQTVPNDDTNEQDPWSTIFARPEAGIADIVQNTAGRAFHDLEDGGIYRCLVCMHEIWQGVCTGCGGVYNWQGEPRANEPDGSEAGSDEHVNNWHYWPHELPEDMDNDEIDDVEVWPYENDWVAEDEEGYESSFIDDEESSFPYVPPAWGHPMDWGTVGMGWSPPHWSPAHSIDGTGWSPPHARITEVGSESDSHGESSGDEVPPLQLGHGRRATRVAISSDESVGSDSGVEVVRVRPSYRGRRNTVYDEDDGSMSGSDS